MCLPYCCLFSCVITIAQLSLELFNFSYSDFSVLEFPFSYFLDSSYNICQLVTYVIKYINHMVNTLPNEIQSIDWSSNIKEIEDSRVTQLGNCPKCGNKVLYYTNAKAANCSSRTKESPGCGFVIWRTVAGKKLTIPQMSQLVTKKRTNLIKGFKKKDGESFEAVILLDDDFNPTFSAPNPKKVKN